MIRLVRSRVVALILSVALGAAWCDEYYSDRGFSIDLPEGFEYLDGDGSTKFSFGSPDGAVRVDIIVYPASRFAGAKSGADDTARRLSGRGSFSSFQYDGRDAALGELSFGSGTAALRGYGFFIDNAESPGPAAGAARDAYDLVVLAYAPASSYDRYRDVVASALDGFSANVGHRATPGPLGAGARAALGAGERRTTSITFGAATVSSTWDPREAAAAQTLVEREYRVLTAYASAPDLIEAAVARFYRMVFRDAASSLDRLALEMSAAWETGAWAGTPSVRSPPAKASGASGSAGPRFGAPADPRGYAEALLAWVQGFRYERDPKGSDVVNPIAAAFEGRGDCDSRALVMAILLRRESIESILMISLKHEHALIAADAPGPGARFPYGDNRWLVGETTAHVGIGMIDAAQSDPADWIGVTFPE